MTAEKSALLPEFWQRPEAGKNGASRNAEPCAAEPCAVCVMHGGAPEVVMGERQCVARKVSNCLWSRFNLPQTSGETPEIREGTWTCVRQPEFPRLTVNQDCSACEFWEQFEEPEKYMW